MKILILTLASLMAFKCHAQEFSARTEIIEYDFTKPEMSIVWLKPTQLIETIDTKKLEIKIGLISMNPIETTTFFLNKLPISSNRGFKKSSSKQNYDILMEQDLFLGDGMNEIKLVIENDKGDTLSSTRYFNVVEGVNLEILNRKKYALLFATDEYEEWDDLNNPVNDAREIAFELQETYGFEVDLIENPSKEVILNTIRDYAEKSYLPHDQLFIFFAGHGKFEPLDGEGYIVSRDSKLDDRINITYIEHSKLSTRIDNIGAPHIFLVIDACFGGTFDQRIARSGSRGQDLDENTVTKLGFIERKLKFKTRVYLTSGGKEYVSDGKAGGNSPFASKFLTALRSSGGIDGILTLGDIKGHVEFLNPEPLMGSFGSNQAGSDFVFERIK